MSLLDIDERILDVAALADFVKSPIVDGKELPDDVDVTIVEGAIASDEHLREIREIREKSKTVIALGDCAVTGNVAACRNMIPVSTVMRHAYVDLPSNDGQGAMPSHETLQKLIDQVVPLHHVIKVDYYIPGCPPNADLIFTILAQILQGRTPQLETQTLRYG